MERLQLLRHTQGRVNGRLRYRAALRNLGQWGEWIALRHVRLLGWDVVARNWKGRRGEVDIIGFDEDWLVFLEVKTRREHPIRPEVQFNSRKWRTLERLAMQFVIRHEISEVMVRFDLIAIETPNLRDFDLRHYTV